MFEVNDILSEYSNSVHFEESGGNKEIVKWRILLEINLGLTSLIKLIS